MLLINDHKKFFLHKIRYDSSQMIFTNMFSRSTIQLNVILIEITLLFSHLYDTQNCKLFSLLK